MKKFAVTIFALVLTLSILCSCGIAKTLKKGENALSGLKDIVDSIEIDSKENDPYNNKDSKSGIKVPDGVKYVEEGTFPVVWPSFGAALLVPKMSGVSLDEPWASEDYATIFFCNLPRTQFDSYLIEVEAMGYNVMLREDDDSYEGNNVVSRVRYEKDNVYVLVEYDDRYNNMMINVDAHEKSN